jgi:hypothetical protein
VVEFAAGPLLIGTTASLKEWACGSTAGLEFVRLAQGAFQPGRTQTLPADIFRLGQQIVKVVPIFLGIVLTPFTQGLFLQFFVHVSLLLIV